MFVRLVQAVAAALVLALGAPCAAEETSANLLVNGDAESHRCTSDWTAQSPVPGWRVVRGATSVLCYAAFGSTGVRPDLPADQAAGQALFVAPGVDSAMEQSVDVSPAASAIDQGSATYQLSGWLGGWSGRVQSALVTAVFLNDRGEATGAPAVLADSDRVNNSRVALVPREVHGPVPAGTRTLRVTVDFPTGLVSFQNAFADNLRLTVGGAGTALSSAPLQAPAGAGIPHLDHVYIVMMENTNYADVVHGDAPSLSIDGHMPFLASLAQRGVILTNMWETYHPSDQNYVAMVAGDTFAYGPVYYPDFDLSATHLGDVLDAHGKSWRGYVQHMNTPCNLVADSKSGWFAPDDEPFANFADVISNSARCTATLRDLNDLEAAVQGGGTLPDFAWIAADGYWDGEGAWGVNFDVGFSQAKQDQFLQSALSSLVQAPQWRDSRSLLVVTWDEANGWGWPDNHVPTILVGSPGLLREGQVIETHYDAYGILRTAELALGVEGLGRFDQYARPLTDIFAGSGDFSQPLPPADLSVRPSQAAATRGRIQATFGQSTVSTAVVQGEDLQLFAQAGLTGAVAIAPLGAGPAQGPRFAVDPSGAATVSTAQLAPGPYGAWLEVAGAPAAHAPLPFTVLPLSALTPANPGVEILGAGGAATDVREGANITVRYCRPDGADPSTVWVGVFAAGTPPDQRTRANTNLISYWLKTPGDSPSEPCGEASAYTSELTPPASYEIWLMKDLPNGSSVSVGPHAQFAFLPTLPVAP